MSETDALEEESRPQAQPSHSQLRQEVLSRIREQINADLARATEQSEAVEDDELSAERTDLLHVEIDLFHIAREAMSELEQAQDATREVAEIRSIAEGSDQRHASDSGIGRFLLQYVVTPLAIALIGGGFAIGAAKIAADGKRTSATTCMEAYATALEISKDHSNFRLPENDPDQQRCDINAVLEASTSVPAPNAPAPPPAPKPSNPATPPP